jgi:hypothetical protein
MQPSHEGGVLGQGGLRKFRAQEAADHAEHGADQEGRVVGDEREDPLHHHVWHERTLGVVRPYMYTEYAALRRSMPRSLTVYVVQSVFS